MTKRHEAKYKIDRRMGQNVWGRPKSPVNRREYGPGQHGQRRKGKLSDYGVQLRAKQKLRGYYGNISERQFRGIYAEAIRMKGDSGAHMIGLLERRLDALIYRAKLVPTVFAARQFISHGHINVNGKRVTIPSYRMKVGDMVEVKEKSKQLAPVLEAVALAERDVPDYIEVNHSKMTAKLTRIPQLSEVPYPVQMEPQLVVEYLLALILPLPVGRFRPASICEDPLPILVAAPATALTRRQQCGVLPSQLRRPRRAAPIDVLIATRAEEADAGRAREAAHLHMAEALHQRLHLRAGNQLVGIPAHPVMNVVHELHAALV